MTHKADENLMRCALVVGHKSTSVGAKNMPQDVSEFEFNARLAVDVWKKLSGATVTTDWTQIVEPVLVWRRTYESLPHDINDVDPKLVVSMHCNAFNQSTSGTEVLFYHRSDHGRRIARVFQDRFVSALHLPDRGIKPVTREDRGGGLLAGTKAPAVICEPFFIDNDDDLGKALSVDLATVYAGAILEGLKLS